LCTQRGRDASGRSQTGHIPILVRARWDAAQARGVALLVVHAGKMSLPILERLGFKRIGSVRVLVDESGA
jgi:hypothetical protein